MIRLEAGSAARPLLAPDAEFDPREFAEFLEADDGPLPIDPDFQEGLRERLWELVRKQADGDEGPGAADPKAPRRDH